MNSTIYIPPSKREGQTMGCSLRWSLVFRSFAAGSLVRIRAITPLLVEWKRGPAQEIRVIFAASRRAPNMARMVTGVWCRLGEHVHFPCVYGLCLARRGSFSTGVPVQSLTTANQRRTLTRILSLCSIWWTRHRKPVLMLPNCQNDRGEWARQRLIFAEGGIRTHICQRLIAEQPPPLFYELCSFKLDAAPSKIMLE